MKRRVFSLLMCLLLVGTCLLVSACGGNSGDNSDSPATGDQATPSTGDASTNVSGDASDSDKIVFQNEAKNWGGETVNILGYNGEYSFHSVQIDAEEASDEPVANAFYLRNELIKQQYGIDVEVILPEIGEYAPSVFQLDITTGLGEYDAACLPIYGLAPLGVEGYLVDFNEVGNDYLHLDQAWWDQTITRDVTLDGHVYFLAGDAIVEDDEATWAIFFNKELVSDYGLDNPYELVREGNWTLDTMYEMVQQVSVTTGDSKVFDPTSADKWGMVSQTYDFFLFMQGCEQRMVDNTGDKPVLRVDSEENVQTFYGVSNILYDKINVAVADDYGAYWEVYPKAVQIFANGNALFMPGCIANVNQATLRDADIKYGILPMPKRSAEQENYSTSVTVYHASVFSLPITNTEKVDVTCYALEAMAFYGKEMVTSEYYDRTLSLKRFEDKDSGEMLDYIFRNRTYDLGAIFDFSNGTGVGTLGFYTNLLLSKDEEIISNYESLKNSFQAGIDKMVLNLYS